MGFVSIYGDEYYVRSTEHEGIIYYCGIAQTEMFRDVLAHAFSLTMHGKMNLPSCGKEYFLQPVSRFFFVR